MGLGALVPPAGKVQAPGGGACTGCPMEEGRWEVSDGPSEVSPLMRFAHQPSGLFLWR